MNIDSSKREAWDRLCQGKTLDGIELHAKNGRVDLSGLELPDPLVLKRFKFDHVPMVEVGPTAIIRGAKWQNLDFTGGKLNGLRLYDCEISNCIFDSCRLQDLRLWSTRISEASFCSADLRKAALGGVENGRRNVFSQVSFIDTDLRGTAYTAAAFDRCIFRNAKLEKIDFQTSTFSRCQFEGELSDILFYRRAFNGKELPPNEMDDVDFSGARLRHVEFRGLSLDHVRLPIDSEHIVISNYSAALDKLIADFQQRQDIASRKLLAYLGVFRKWAVPGQARGVLNVEDLAEIGGPEGVERIRELLMQ